MKITLKINNGKTTPPKKWKTKWIFSVVLVTVAVVSAGGVCKNNHNIYGNNMCVACSILHEKYRDIQKRHNYTKNNHQWHPGSSFSHYTLVDIMSLVCFPDRRNNNLHLPLFLAEHTVVRLDRWTRVPHVTPTLTCFCWVFDLVKGHHEGQGHTLAWLNMSTCFTPVMVCKYINYEMQNRLKLEMCP